MKGFSHHVRLSSTREEKLAVHNEPRHAINPQSVELSHFGQDLVPPFLGRHELFSYFLFDAGRCRDDHQIAPITHVHPVHEVSVEERLDDGILLPKTLSQSDQTMSVERVGRAFDSVEMELDALGRPHCRQTSIQHLRMFEAAELRPAIGISVDSFFEHRRIQLERPPRYFDLSVWSKQSDGFFETPFADVAPRADHVRDDLDFAGNFADALDLAGGGRSVLRINGWFFTEDV